MLLKRSATYVSMWFHVVSASRLPILATVVTGAGFGLAGAYLVLRSRRKIRVLEAELAQQSARTNAAETANRSKTEFLTGLSDQIRTPLKAIIGLTDLTLKSELNPAFRECLDTLRTSADWLRRVAIEAGALKLENVPFSLSECVHSTVRLAQPDASAKKLTLTCSLDRRLPERVQGDSVYLQYVIYKLLESAVHSANRGSVQLSVGIKAETKDGVMIRVSVQDTGIGFTAAACSSTSGPCPSINSDALPTRPDSGVGLSTARQMVELMGGTMNAETQPGGDIRFEFTAGLGKLANVQMEVLEKVLIQDHLKQGGLEMPTAEDGTLDRELIITVLEPAGRAADYACDGKDAVTRASSEAYDLVPMDLDMPGTGNSQPTRPAEPSEEEADHLPASTVTAEPSAEDTARWLDEEMDEFMRGPRDELLLDVSDLNRASVHHPDIELIVTAERTAASAPEVHEATSVPIDVAFSQDLTASDSEEPCQELAEEDQSFQSLQAVPNRWRDFTPAPVTAHMTVPPQEILGASASLLRLAQLQPTPMADWDPFEQARKALFKSRFDVRVIHQDGDPSNRNLI